MPIDFPNSPALNSFYTYNGVVWQWNGSSWITINMSSPTFVSNLNGLCGGVGISAGTNITITPSGNTLTIASTASGGAGTPAGVTGSVQFNTGTAFGGFTGFIWDNTNIRLGIGLTAPTMALDVVGNGEFTGELFVTANLIRVTTIARNWFL